MNWFLLQRAGFFVFLFLTIYFVVKKKYEHLLALYFFGMTFHIHSFLTASKDADVPPDVRATYSIGDIYQVYEILRDLRAAERSPQTCAGSC